MLFNIENQEQSYIPHEKSYRKWRANLSDQDYWRIIDEIHRIMDSTPTGQHVITSSYIPGSDWSGTVYEPIWHACIHDFDSARFFFGQLVWDAVMQHSGKWYFIRQDKGNDQPVGMSYFQPER